MDTCYASQLQKEKKNGRRKNRGTKRPGLFALQNPEVQLCGGKYNKNKQNSKLPDLIANYENGLKSAEGKPSEISEGQTEISAEPDLEQG